MTVLTIDLDAMPDVNWRRAVRFYVGDTSLSLAGIVGSQAHVYMPDSNGVVTTADLPEGPAQVRIDGHSYNFEIPAPNPDASPTQLAPLIGVAVDYPAPIVEQTQEYAISAAASAQAAAAAAAGAEVSDTVGGEIATQVPPAVSAEVAVQVPPAVTTNIQSRDMTAVDLGNSTVQFRLGGVDMGDPYTLPGAAWSSLAGKPAVLAAGANQAEARAAVDAWGPSRRDIRRARPGVVRRVQAPGNLSWLDSHIRVFYDGHKFFTDFDITQYRHTGTKWYSDREHGVSANSGLGVELTTALVAGVAVTSLDVTALPETFPSGSKVVVATQDAYGVWQSFVATLSALGSASATTISVDSVIPAAYYPVGSLVANPTDRVYANYRKAAPGDQLIMLDRNTNTFGGIVDRTGGWGFGEASLGTKFTTTASLSTGAPITTISVTGLSGNLMSGNYVTVESGNHSQTFRLAANASSGATSISVVSQTPNFDYPSGSTMWRGNRLAISITVAAMFPGEVKLVMGDWHTWAPKAGTTNVYTVTRSVTQKVVDSGVGEFGMEYTLVADATECDGLPGSYYISGSEVGVHSIEGGVPDPKRVHVLIDSNQFTVRNENGDMSCYLSGFQVWGGAQVGNIRAENTAAGNLDLYCHRMDFLYPVVDTIDADSVNIDGARYAFFQDCRSAFGPKDGFNYHAYDRLSVLRNATKFIEVDCESWAHGLASSSDVNNATTAHDGCQGVRIGGKYHETKGAVIADVHTDTETWNVECDAWGSKSAVESADVAIVAQQAGTTMHIWNCRAFDGLSSINAVSETTVNIYNTEYDVLGPNAGTYNLLTSV